MKKIIISTVLASNLVFGFGLDSITSMASSVGESLSKIDFNNESTISVDRECTNQFENYDFNMSGILKVTAMHGMSNSNKIMNFLNSDKSSSEQITPADFKKFARVIAKNYLWIPLEVEKLYGEEIYKNRVQNGDVVLRNTKNLKYKKLYKKIDSFLKEYTSYVGEKNIDYPYDIKVFILSSQNKAEAAPYGYIFISEDYVEDDRFKTVLSHELAHISKRHTTKEIQYRMVNTYDTVTEVASLIKNLQDINSADKIVYGFAGTEVIKKSFEYYSQNQEIEADACGFRTLNKISPNNKNEIVSNFINNINEGYHYKDEEGVSLKEHPDKEVRIENLNTIKEKI